MSGTLPNDSEVQIVVCDDIRIEMNNKLSLIGYYVANRINVGDVGPTIAIPVAFLLVVSGGEGEFSMKFDIKSPSGKKLFSHAHKIPKLRVRPAAHVVKVLNFPIPELGDYPFEITLDDRPYRCIFNIGRDPSIKMA